MSVLFRTDRAISLLYLRDVTWQVDPTYDRRSLTLRSGSNALLRFADGVHLVGISVKIQQFPGSCLSSNVFSWINFGNENKTSPGCVFVSGERNWVLISEKQLQQLQLQIWKIFAADYKETRSGVALHALVNFISRRVHSFWPLTSWPFCSSCDISIQRRRVQHSARWWRNQDNHIAPQRR